MTLYVYDSFLRDLHAHRDGNFAQRVIRKLLNANGSFKLNADDHRFRGVDNAWVRYVSTGASAYRAIYIRDGENIYLYRAGEHSIEDNLGPPRGNRSLAELVFVDPAPEQEPQIRPQQQPAEPDMFRKNGHGRLLRNFLLGRRLFPHKEIYLVSPFVTTDILRRTHRVGEAFNQLMEDGSKILLLTRPPTLNEIEVYRELEARGWDLLFHKALHAKLYIFKLENDPQTAEQGVTDAALIGSANLTEKGFGFSDVNLSEELCYELPLGAHAGAMDYVTRLASQAEDLKRISRTLNRRN